MSQLKLILPGKAKSLVLGKSPIKVVREELLLRVTSSDFEWLLLQVTDKRIVSLANDLRFGDIVSDQFLI